MKEFFFSLTIAIGALICLTTVSFFWSYGSQWGGYLGISQIQGYLLPINPAILPKKTSDARTLGGAVASEAGQ